MSASTFAPRGRLPSKRPSLRLERTLQREGFPLLAGMDEVGRGALAGPVSVGVVVIGPTCRSAPAGVKDSKLLTHRSRSAMVPRLRRWARAYAVGHTWPAEIDAIGIMAALRLAGMRALGSLGLVPDLIILDGNYDWLTDPARVGLFAELGDAPRVPPVRTLIKADMKCSSVAAASVLAKVERDGIMVDLAAGFAQYHWAENKGYAATEHCAALEAYGPCVHHRQSWRLPGLCHHDGGFDDARVLMGDVLADADVGQRVFGPGNLQPADLQAYAHDLLSGLPDPERAAPRTSSAAGAPPPPGLRRAPGATGSSAMGQDEVVGHLDGTGWP